MPSCIMVGFPSKDRNSVADSTMGRQQRPGAIRVFDAVYEDGVLKPLQDPGLPEHHRFSVQVQELGETQAAGELAAWHQVYEGLSEENLAAVEEIALDRSRFSSSRPEFSSIPTPSPRSSRGGTSPHSARLRST